MPWKEKEDEKLFYSISEVATLFEVNASLIRFWEKEFELLKPAKTKKGNRQFTKSDIETFRMIHHLVKVKGYTIQGAKDKLRSGKDDAAKEAQMIQSLTRVREFLVELRKQLQAPTQHDRTPSHEA
jgi:DNA-binding transcriptional MerR regulator